MALEHSYFLRFLETQSLRAVTTKLGDGVDNLLSNPNGISTHDYNIMQAKFTEQKILTANYFCANCKEFYTEYAVDFSTNTCKKCKSDIFKYT
jgi:hypothetical protein